MSTKKHRLDNGQPSPTKCIQQAIQPSKQHRPWWLHYRWPSVRLVKLTTGSNSGKPRQLVPFPFSHPLELWTCRIGENPKTTHQKNGRSPIYWSLDHPKNKNPHNTRQLLTRHVQIIQVFMTSNGWCQGCWIIILQWCSAQTLQKENACIDIHGDGGNPLGVTPRISTFSGVLCS